MSLHASFNNFIVDPTKYNLRIKTSDHRQEIVAEKKSRISTKIGRRIFARNDYKMKNVLEVLAKVELTDPQKSALKTRFLDNLSWRKKHPKLLERLSAICGIQEAALPINNESDLDLKNHPDFLNVIANLKNKFPDVPILQANKMESDSSPIDSRKIDWDRLIQQAFHLPQTQTAGASAKASWEALIESAHQKSPGAELDNLETAKRKKIEKNEWLVNDTLTGICMGLAIDYILRAELGKETIMAPSSNVRYWEKNLIPIMFEVAADMRVDSPWDLKENGHYDEVYNKMGECVEKIAGLRSDIVSSHRPLAELTENLREKKGHLLLCVENPGQGVAANHVVYINPDTRTIADGADGSTIQLPDDQPFDEFLNYYVTTKYNGQYSQFSLIAVGLSDVNEVRMPSRFDKLKLSMKLLRLGAAFKFK